MIDAHPERVLKTRAVAIHNPGNEMFPFQRNVVFKGEAGATNKAEVLKDLERVYKYWDSQGNLRSKIRQWQNDSEGIVTEPPKFPWNDSSAVVKKVIETRQNIIHSFFMSIIRPLIGKLFTCVVSNKASPEERSQAKIMAQHFNTDHDFNRMVVDSMDEAFWAVLTDGTVGRSIDWLRVVEPRWETRTFSSPEELNQAYPTPDSLGVSEDVYLSYLQKIQVDGKVMLDLEHDVMTVDRPDIDVELLKDLVIYPLTVSRQERTRFIGRVIKKRKSEMESLVKAKVYVKEAVDKVLSQRPVADPDTVAQNQNTIEGIQEPEDKEDYTFIHGRYLKDLDGDGIEEKYLVTYAVEAKVYVQLDKYPFWHNQDFIQLSRFKRRAKRMLGRGVSEMLADTQLEATIQARFRINCNAITNAPQLIIDDSLKSQINPFRKDGKIMPGGAWYVPAAKMGQNKAVMALELPDKERGDAIAEESILNRDADNLLGASELRSGRETPSDPRAPAAKTALLLQQSGMRLDDFIFFFILRENDVLDLAKKLYYQFGPEEIKFNVEEDGNLIEQEVKKSWFNSENIHLQLVVTSLLDNPDYLEQRWGEFLLQYGPHPMLSQPETQHNILTQIVDNRPEANGKGILPPLEKILQSLPPAPAGAAPAPAGPASPLNPTLKASLTKAGGRI